MKNMIFAAALLAAMGSAQAQMSAPAPMPSPARFLLGFGLSAGGDEIARATFIDRDSASLHAGGLAYFTAGLDYRFTPQFSLQGTVNYHWDRTDAKNGYAKFERYPVELIGYYQPNPAWRVGGGVRYVSSAKLSGSGFASGADASFDSTTSAVIEGEYFTSPRIGIKLRYVNETYKARGWQDVDGSHIGLSANFYF